MPDSAGAVSVDIKTGKNEVKPALQSLGGVAKGIGGKIAVALGGATLAAFSKSCIEAASAAQQTSNRVAAVFPKMQAQVDAFASGAMTSMGMGAGSAKAMMAQFGMMAQGMGIAERDAAGMSAAMAKLAGDMSAFYGISAQDAQGKLAGVFTGMTRGMKALGVNMSEANLQAHALSLGVSKNVADMTEAELAALRLSYAQTQLSKTSGYAQRNLSTWAGQTALLGQQAAKLRSTLGKAFVAALLPAVKVANMLMSALVGAANTALAVVEKLTGKKVDSLIGGATGAVADLGEATDDASDSTFGLESAQRSAAKAAKAQEKAQKSLNRALAGFDKINKLAGKQKAEKTASADEPAALSSGPDLSGQMLAASGLSGALAGVNAEGAKLKDIKLPPALEKALVSLREAASPLIDKLQGAGKWVYDNVLAPLAGWAMDKAAPKVLDALSAAFSALSAVCDALAPVFQALWNALFKPLAKFAGDAVCAMLDGITGALKGISDFAEKHPKAFKAIAAGLVGIWGAVKLFKVARALKAGKALSSMGRAGKLLAKAGGPLKSLLRFVGKHPVGVVIAAAATAIGYVYKNWGKIKKTKVGKALQKLFKALKPVGKFLAGAAAKALEKVASLVKKAAKALAPLTEAAGEFAAAALDAFGDAVAGAIETVAGVVGGLGEAWDGIKAGTKTLVAEAKEKAAGALDALKGGWAAVKDKAATLSASVGTKWNDLKGAWEGLVGNVADKTADFKGQVATKWADLKAAWEGLKEKIDNKVADFKGKVATTWADLKDKWNALKEKIDNKVAKFMGQVATKWGDIKDAWEGLKAKVAGKTESFKAKVATKWADIKEKWNALKDKVKGKTEEIKLKIGTTLESAKTFANNIISGINGKLNGLKWPSWVPGIGNKTIFPKNPIPAIALAQGGYVERNTPRLAVIGDNRHEGEVVSPESKLDEMARKAASGAGADTSAVEALLRQLIEAVRAQGQNGVYLDGREITRAVVANVNGQTRQTGRCPIVV